VDSQNGNRKVRNGMHRKKRQSQKREDGSHEERGLCLKVLEKKGWLVREQCKESQKEDAGQSKCFAIGEMDGRANKTREGGVSDDKREKSLDGRWDVAEGGKWLRARLGGKTAQEKSRRVKKRTNLRREADRL